jgi:phosphoribosylformylglycinamidine synthase I
VTRIGVVVFPGTNCEHDTVYALRRLGVEASLVWHREESLEGFDGVVLPGGFAHGDYLRTGAIARFSPIMRAVEQVAAGGRPVLGICNGFQVLCEAGLLPGALIANAGLAFLCRWVEIEVVSAASALTWQLEPGTVIRIPLNSYQGNYVDPARRGRVVARYLDDPNGAQEGTAAVANEQGNVVGIMPHPERASEEILGSADGERLLSSFVAYARQPAGV